MSCSTNAALLVFISTLANVALAGDCTDGPINQSIKTWGKDADNGEFCHTRWTTGLSVTGLEIWASQWQMLESN
jgi:hypothetical protein